jgi:hypothetical protein
MLVVHVVVVWNTALVPAEFKFSAMTQFSLPQN